MNPVTDSTIASANIASVSTADSASHYSAPVDLSTMSLESLNINRPLMRTLVKAGYSNIFDVFDLGDQAIADLLGSNQHLLSEFDRLFDLYSTDPEAFMNEVAAPSASGFASGSKHSSIPGIFRRPADAAIDPVASSSTGVFDLYELNERAERVFKDLADRLSNVYVYQVFPIFAGDLVRLRAAFKSFFKRFRGTQDGGVRKAGMEYPAALLLFTADLACESVQSNGVWPELFETAGIAPGFQSEYKHVIYRALCKHSMPVFERGEETNRYYYSVLLHAGLTKTQWCDLWEKTLFPMARRVNSSIGLRLDTQDVLRAIVGDGGASSPNAQLATLFKKVPTSMTEPMLKSAIKVAIRLVRAHGDHSNHLLFDDLDLPLPAVDGLRLCMDQGARVRAEASHARRFAGSACVGAQTSYPELVSMPKADLCLDMERHQVYVCWSQRSFGPALLGCEAEYRLDGSPAATQQFSVRDNECILPEKRIAVDAQAVLDAEIALVRQVSSNDYGVEQKVTQHLGSLSRSFSCAKPGCFEFVWGIDGTWRLRDKGFRIGSTRMIAYLMLPGYSIVGGKGMTCEGVYGAGQGWEDAQIQVFTVEPGASGTVRHQPTEGPVEEVACWHESFTTHIDCSRAIGVTEDGLDLYGYATDELGCNAALPSITIQTADGASALDDLDIACFFEGEQVSVSRRRVWDDEESDRGAARVELLLQKSRALPDFCPRVEVVARQRSCGGRIVFRYCFAVVPMQGFSLQGAQAAEAGFGATYGFTAVRNLVFVDLDRQKASPVQRGERFELTAPLVAEQLNARLADPEGTFFIDVKLALAGIQIKLPEALVRTAAQHPVCLADLLELGSARTTIAIEVHGRRKKRMGFMAMFDRAGVKQVFMYQGLGHAGSYEVNLASFAAGFVPHGETELASIEQGATITLEVMYGEKIEGHKLVPAISDIKLFDCCQGVGFSSHKLLVDARGARFVRFDAPVLCNLEARFAKATGGERKELAVVKVAKGQDRIELPADVANYLGHRPVTLTLTPTTRFSTPRPDLAFDLQIAIHRER